MRVIYDFMARNNRELTIMKGEVVEVRNRNKKRSQKQIEKIVLPLSKRV